MRGKKRHQQISKNTIYASPPCLSPFHFTKPTTFLFLGKQEEKKVKERKTHLFDKYLRKINSICYSSNSVTRLWMRKLRSGMVK